MLLLPPPAAAKTNQSPLEIFSIALLLPPPAAAKINQSPLKIPPCATTSTQPKSKSLNYPSCCHYCTTCSIPCCCRHHAAAYIKIAENIVAATQQLPSENPDCLCSHTGKSAAAPAAVITALQHISIRRRIVTAASFAAPLKILTATTCSLYHLAASLAASLKIWLHHLQLYSPAAPSPYRFIAKSSYLKLLASLHLLLLPAAHHHLLCHHCIIPGCTTRSPLQNSVLLLPLSPRSCTCRFVANRCCHSAAPQ
jgi:hypothetical protein